MPSFILIHFFHVLTYRVELQSSVESRQKLDGQKQENLGVQKVGVPSRQQDMTKANTD